MQANSEWLTKYFQKNAMSKTKDICTPGGKSDNSLMNPHSVMEAGSMDSGENRKLQGDVIDDMKHLSLSEGRTDGMVENAVQCAKRSANSKVNPEEQGNMAKRGAEEMVENAVLCTKRSAISKANPMEPSTSDKLLLLKRQKHARKRERKRQRKAGNSVGGSGGGGITTSTESTPEETPKRSKRFKGEIRCTATTPKASAKGVTPTLVDQVLPGRTLRKAGESSHQVPRGARRPKTFSEVLGNSLHMGIICEGGLDESKLAIVRSAFLNALDSLPEDAGDIGIIDVKLEDGIITVKCVNQESKDWLCGIVGKMTDLWEGIQLRIDSLTSIRNFKRMILRIPGTPVNSGVILARLRRQNACVGDTSKWRVTRTGKYEDGREGGCILTVFCPAEEAEKIKRAGGKLNCGLDFAYARFCAEETLQNASVPVGQL